MGMSLTLDGSNSVTINSGAILGITSGTAVAPTSGTSIDFTSIPSWVKRITVMFNGVSTNGTSIVQVQLGTGGTPTYTTSGYLSAAWQGGSTNVGTTSTTGFTVSGSVAAANTLMGAAIFTLVTGNTWISSGTVAVQPTGQSGVGGLGGNVALASALTAVRITTVNGTDAFDAGSVNILYE
jgi:hypothetical protein